MDSLMKTLLVSLLCIFATRLLQAEMDVGTIMQDMDTCKEAVNMTQEEFDNVMAMQIPSSPEGKCFVKCMMKSMYVINEEGEFNKQACAALLAEAPVDDEEKEKMKDIPDTCEKQVPKTEDHCEYAYKITLCMKEQAEANGVKSPM